jgi:Protein of unknown function (DUF2867)/Family of unknown function (DUF6463)
MSRRLPDAEHTARSWRIHEVAPDFEVEDVWAFHTPGAGPDDFPVMMAALRAAGGLDGNPPVVRFLFAVRWKLGALLGWDQPQAGLAGRVRSLRDRLPRDLRATSSGEPVPNTPFTMVYELPDECAAELANSTVHDICHLGWVPTDGGEHELRMAALVKPNGVLGRLYLAAIKPFRYLVVYPALTRQWERAWRDRDRHLAPRVATTAGPAPLGAPGTAAAQDPDERADRRPAPVVRLAGRLIVLFGAAHTVGALTVEGAARHAGEWLAGALRGADLSDMSPANSAYWLSVMSFGPPLVLLGLTVLWLDRRGITPPAFIGWSLGIWTVVDLAVAGPQSGQGLVLLLAAGLLLAASRRTDPGPHVAGSPGAPAEPAASRSTGT